MFENRFMSTRVDDDENYVKFIDSLKFNYSAIYRGYVVDTDDPLRLGRVKVRIPQLYGSEDNQESESYVPTYSIPWATSAIMVGAGNNTGSYLIPSIGDIVFVTFEGSNARQPLYFGGVLNINGGETSYIGSPGINNDQPYNVETSDVNTDITNKAQRVIYKSIKGATIIIDDSDGNESIKIIDQLGQIISMENTSGEILQRDRDKTATGNMKHKRGKIVLQSSVGNTISISDDEIYIKAPKVRIDTDNYTVNTKESDFNTESDFIDSILAPYQEPEAETEAEAGYVEELLDKMDVILDYKESDPDE